ncbi:hypothetical protein AB3G45_15345 [Shinella sp. S4-D37]|uniref:hypothetical protein n=1 Tax=Shinella sp. S4-D37 TaxID=3161999 RepID=UPI003467484C
MSNNWIKAAAFAAGILLGGGSGYAQEGAKTDRKTPSIVYYGAGLNQRVDEQKYLANQQQISVSQPHYTEGRQGQHLARMEEATRQRTATGYGAISDTTGNTRTIFVTGHTRANGERVRPYYRSKR